MSFVRRLIHLSTDAPTSSEGGAPTRPPSAVPTFVIPLFVVALAAVSACAGSGSDVASPPDTAPADIAKTDVAADAAVRQPCERPALQPSSACVFPEGLPPEGCNTCHQSPPQTPTHPPNPWCWRCHGYVIDKNYEFIQPELHQNGHVDVAVGCTSCHGWNLGAAPPQGLDGSCDYGGPGVGAHAAMRRGGPAAHHTGCNNCHIVPTSLWQEGHIDGDGRAEVVFGNLATAGGAEPVWDGETCSSVYCHGATLKGGDLKNPRWTDTTGAPGRCGACHSLTDPDGNTDVDCSTCHPTSVDANGCILEYGTHINGHIDLSDELDAEGHSL